MNPLNPSGSATEKYKLEKIKEEIKMHSQNSVYFKQNENSTTQLYINVKLHMPFHNMNEIVTKLPLFWHKNIIISVTLFAG